MVTDDEWDAMMVEGDILNLWHRTVWRVEETVVNLNHIPVGDIVVRLQRVFFGL